VPPTFVRPCIPTTAKTIPHGDAWLHEPKLDGYRFQIVKDDLVLQAAPGPREGARGHRWLSNGR
jgi:hypothetical protein